MLKNGLMGIKGMKCITCELDFDYYDESNQCLHCWRISNNIECDCAYIDENY